VQSSFAVGDLVVEQEHMRSRECSERSRTDLRRNNGGHGSSCMCIVQTSDISINRMESRRF